MLSNINLLLYKADIDGTKLWVDVLLRARKTNINVFPISNAYMSCSQGDIKKVPDEEIKPGSTR